MARPVTAITLAGLVLVLAGCGGSAGSKSVASERTTGATDTTATTGAAATGGGACGELTALARAVGPTLRVTPDEAVAAKSDDFRNASSALFDYTSRAPEDIKADISMVSAGWDDVAGRLSELELQSGSPDATSVNLTNGHIRETLVEPGYMDSSARVLAWLNSEAAKCPDSDATDQALGGKQLGEVDDAATAAVNDALSQRTEADSLSAPLGAEVRNCRKVRELSADSLIAPGGTGYSCEVWFEGEMKFDGAPAVIDANGKVVTIP